MTAHTMTELSPVAKAACSLACKLTKQDRIDIGSGVTHEVDVMLRITGTVTAGSKPEPYLAGGKPELILAVVLGSMRSDQLARMVNMITAAVEHGSLEADANAKEIARALVGLTKTECSPSPKLTSALTVDVA